MAKVLIGNVRGPQGPKGDPGEIGPQGPQGPQGPVGPAVTETDPTVPEWAKQETPPVKPGEDLTDSTVSYVKSVPADSAPYAEIVEIGGMMQKCNQLWDEEWVLGYYDNSQGGALVSYTNRFACKNKIRVQPNTKYYISATDTVDICFYNSNEEFIDNSGYDSSRRFTTPSDCAFITFNLWLTYGTSYKNDIMLNEGSTALPYEPYFEGLRSAPVTEVESVGVNLAGEPIALANLTYNNGVYKQANADTETGQLSFKYLKYKGTSNYVGLIATRVIYSTAVFFQEFTKDEGFDTLVFGFNGKKIDTLCFIDVSHLTNGKTYCLSVNITNLTQGSLSWCDVMLNEGITALPYIPYFHDTLPIPEAVRNLDGYGWGINESVYNYIDLEKNQYVQRVGCVDLGAVNWGYYENSYFAVSVNTFAQKSKGGANFLCAKYTKTAAKTDAEMVTAEDQIICTNNDYNGTWINIKDSNYTDATTFKAAISGVMLYYELATPIITDITDLLPDNLIKVQGGGTVTMVNEYGYDVPNTLRFRTGNNEVIGADVFVGDLHGTAARAKMAETDALGKVIHKSYAPAGYGLGGASKDISGVDLNTVTANGWYQFANAGANCPVGGYSYMFVASRNEDHVTQTVYASNNIKLAGNTMKRARLNGEWYPWEYENPYMELGVEYRTTERWQGKPVYVKLIDIGALPDSSTKEIAHNVSGAEQFFYVFGSMVHSNGNMVTIPYYETPDNYIGISAQRNVVKIVSNHYASPFSGTLLLKYTKTTN